MPLAAFVLILTGVLLNAAAQLLLKAGVRTVGSIELTLHNVWTAGRVLAFEPHILAGLACYVASVVVWIVALSRVDVSKAYPMLSVGYIVTAIAAWYLFDEPMTAARVAGILIIVVGVCLVARG